MKKLTFVLFLLTIIPLAFPVKSFAQETTINVGIEDFLYYQRLGRDVIKRTKNPYAQIKGNPYLFKDYADGEIVTTDSFRYKGKMRYNMHEDEIEYLVSDDNFWISNPWVLDHVKIDSLIFIYYSEEDNSTDKGSYFVLLVDGKCKLLFKKSVILNDPVPAKPYVEAKPAEFVDRRDMYYILFNDSELEKINSKRKLRKLLSVKGGKIKKYIKDVSVKKEEDLVRLVEYYNGIKE